MAPHTLPAGSSETIHEIEHILRPQRRRSTTDGPPLTGALDTRTLAVVASSGKLLRSHILRESYRVLGGVDTAVAARLGAIIEVLHAAFLAHDDVIDGDLIRRGKPNVAGQAVHQARKIGIDAESAARYGSAVGILAGDKLLNAAWYGLADMSAHPRWSRLLRSFRSVIDDSIDGEHDDVAYALTPDAATLDSAFKVAIDKTARYSIALPLEFAAIAADRDDELVAVLSRLGDLLGLAYQLDDDILGVFGDPRVTGKSVTSDLETNKATALSVLARRTTSWAYISPYIGRPMTSAELASVRGLLIDSGVVDAARTIIASTTDRAHELLHHPAVPAELRSYFDQLIPTLTGRAA